MKKNSVLTVIFSVMLMQVLLALPCKGETDPETTQSGGAVYDEMAMIENAYARVVKYYNKSMDDGQAVKIARLLLYYADKYDLDPRLMVAVIVVESNFKPHAVSPKGAVGLGQLMPGTARSLGVSNAYDVSQNIYGTARYLRMMYDRWQDNDNVLDRMLASYNAGPEAVAKYNGIPPYSETQKYVKKVKKLYRFFVYGS